RRINYSHAYLFSGVYYHSFLIIFFYFPPMFFFQIIPPLLSPPLFPYTTLFRSVDPLEEGMDPPEHWSEADAYGTAPVEQQQGERDRKSTRLNSSHVSSSYAVFCLKKKK